MCAHVKECVEQKDLKRRIGVVLSPLNKVCDKASKEIEKRSSFEMKKISLKRQNIWTKSFFLKEDKKESCIT